MYFVKAPFWLRAIYGSLIWRIPTDEPVLYLTFDDGPHATATAFVLDQLRAFDAKASFFCIGKNVVQEPELFARILAEGHRVGNHTQHHLNGWKTSESDYLQDIATAAESIDSNLFRPPYGRIRMRTISKVKDLLTKHQDQPGKILMWDVLSADFDTSISGEQCFQNVIRYARNGSVIVFHDSAKAMDRLTYALPKVLAYYQKLGYQFRVIPDGEIA